MRYHALASDYDGTLATDGFVVAPTSEALARLQAAGRSLILVTGRLLDDLQRVYSVVDRFDAVVAENGAVVWWPRRNETRTLVEPPPARFVESLRARGVDPLSQGQVIVSTRRPHEGAVLEAIRALGLELQVIFNKGAVMVLPSGVNKATGLDVALRELGLSPHDVVAIGDAENDHAFLSRCECAVAVANALPAIKEHADLVTAGGEGAGVAELITRLLATDLEELAPALSRHDIPLGEEKGEDGGAGSGIVVPAYGTTLLVAGTSGGGKSTVVLGLLERMAALGYQHCIIDPEGDYGSYEHAVVLGDARRAPTADEVLEVLADPGRNVAVNLLGLSIDQRPVFFDEVLPRLQETRARFGRPHWLIVDEAHHLLPDTRETALAGPRERHGNVLITVHPEHVSRATLEAVDQVLAIGKVSDETLAEVTRALGLAPPSRRFGPLEPGEAVLWERRSAQAPRLLRTRPPRAERKRHVRKYAEGELGPDKSFYFRGPGARLNLRAQNLRLFLQVADGVDAETWLHHLRRSDYSRWVRDAIKDQSLADKIAAIERAGDDAARSAAASRAAVREAIEARYTEPA
jgi:hypothetical protein